MTDTRIDITNLETAISGRVIRPEDADYDQARTIFYGGFDRRPTAVVRVANTDDVARVVSLATEAGVELAIRSGGHSVAGHGLTDGIVLDLTEMRSLEIDPQERIAWAETGLSTGDYTVAADAHGLATGFGDTSTVGIGGLSLGGGVGLMVRKHGLTIDNILAAEVVTADGRILAADEETNPDLFWAIRGGGGNFGVVTRLKFRLHEAGDIVGGMMILPATPESVAGFVAAAEAAPEELSAIVNVMVAPPMPFLPAEVHGRVVLFSLLAHIGDLEAGDRAVAPFLDVAEPIVNMVGRLRYPALFEGPPEQEGFHPVAAARNMFLDTFDEGDAGTIIEHLQASTAMMSATQLRVLGGAFSRVPSEATAFAHRHRKIMTNVAAIYTEPDETPTHTAWVEGLAAELSSGENGAYVGFVGDEGQEGVRRAYPEPTWSRLREVKRRYDPDNVFHRNQNIPPA